MMVRTTNVATMATIAITSGSKAATGPPKMMSSATKLIIDLRESVDNAVLSAERGEGHDCATTPASMRRCGPRG